jgi:O-succinylhomoserine sulfhydrylase
VGERGRVLPKTCRPATQLVHGGIRRSQFGELSEAMFMTQSYVYDSAEAADARFKGIDSGFIYSRTSNPTTSMFEERIALLEGAEAARATASGMASVTAALMGQVKAGDHVVAARALFGSCRYIVEDLLPRFGVETTLVDGGDLDQWRKAMRRTTRTCFLETPSNPTLDVYDIAAIAEIARAHGASLVVDNALASPLVQRPLDFGADCVVYSATKHIDGQGRCLAGVILASEAFIQAHVHTLLRQTGPSLSPFNAWVMLKSLETMPARLAVQQASAARVADFLAEQPEVERVLYPARRDHPHHSLAQRQMRGGGTIVSFTLKLGREAAFRFSNALSIISLSNNFGDAKSILTQPAITTHQRFSPAVRAEMGISDGLLRLSLGLEDVEDLMADLSHALHAVRHG